MRVPVCNLRAHCGKNKACSGRRFALQGGEKRYTIEREKFW